MQLNCPPILQNDKNVQQIYCSFYQQATTDKIRRFNNGTFPCVIVNASIMLINYNNFAFFSYRNFMQAKKLLLFFAKNS